MLCCNGKLIQYINASRTFAPLRVLSLREHIFRVGESPLDFVLVGPSVEHHFVAESEVRLSFVSENFPDVMCVSLCVKQEDCQEWRKAMIQGGCEGLETDDCIVLQYFC